VPKSKIIVGDCRDILPTLDAGSVHTCVTSPPYFGLRRYFEDGVRIDPRLDPETRAWLDVSLLGSFSVKRGSGVPGMTTYLKSEIPEDLQRYFVPAEMGTEPTPDEFVAALVDVFRHVRRVLRDDGTVWLNLGDSYAMGTRGAGGKGKQHTNAGSCMSDRGWAIPPGLKPKDLIGIPWRVAFALQQPFYNWQIKTEAMRAWVGGIVDGEGCITILETKSSHSASLSYPPILQVRMCDLEPLDRLVQVVGSSYGKPQHPPSQVAANQRPSYQWKVVSEQAASVIAEIYPFLTCKRKQAIVAWNHQAFRSTRGNQARQSGDIEKEQFCKTLINSLNQRESIDLPSWMEEPTIAYEPGWYLRQDLIWNKPNPMPESVRDRCTKAHEYIFLLSKSARYYFDADAIKEPATGRDPRNKSHKYGDAYEAGDSEEHRTKAGLKNVGARETRNRRSVWTVASQPYSGAHFACVDEKTECLTQQGWKYHDDLETGMNAAQFDIESGGLSWSPIQGIARYTVENQQMVAAKSRDVEMLLTPNHRTIIARRHNQTRQWKSLTIIRADELKPSHAVPVSAPWDVCGDAPFSDDWAELLGWYIAEGCETSHSWTVEIYQSRSANADKVDRISSLLHCVGAEFSVASATRQWHGETRTCVAFQIRGFAAAFLRQWAPNKNFHPDVLTWSDVLLSRLLLGLVAGDGHRRTDGRFSFIQRNQYGADMAQAIGVRLGYATMRSRRSDRTFVVYFTCKRLISFRGTEGEGAEIGQVPYTGVVWCPRLPAGTWVARKNGRAFITGNTYPPKLIEPCILAGAPVGGLVLDPFAGAGTTGLVAQQLGRNFIGCELYEKNVTLATDRIESALQKPTTIRVPAETAERQVRQERASAAKQDRQLSFL
jgi:DNA modification methylase